ncbi:MAG: M15 family metallopeptidase [Acidimicrobiales bacterium]
MRGALTPGDEGGRLRAVVAGSARGRRAVLAVLTVLGVLAAGCATVHGTTPSPPTGAAVLPSSPAAPAKPPAAAAPATAAVPATAPSATAAVPATAPSGPVATTTPSGAPPPFTSTTGPVTAAQLGGTWHPGCPVGPSQLRLLHLAYWGFDNRPHTGTMVVNASQVGKVTDVFSTLYQARFPLREMVPESAYGGNDNRSAAADDTSGFNCRLAVAPGAPQWSVHAYGEAIDVNDVQNPYYDGANVIPPAGTAYRDRSDVRPGMAVPGGTLVEAFASVGWQWGGRWTGSPDYQHFSSTGG